jgi:hypothetical protein
MVIFPQLRAHEAAHGGQWLEEMERGGKVDFGGFAAYWEDETPEDESNGTR